MHQSSSVAASGLGVGAGPSNIHQTIGVAGETQHSQRNIHLRRAPEDEQLGLLFKPSGFINQNLFANDSSNSSCLMISSGITEYIVEENDDGEEYIVEENDGGVGCSLDVEENDGGESFSLDGKYLYYKRKALEDEQLGARLVLALKAAPIMHQPSSVAASVLGAGAGPSDIHQAIGVAGEAQHGQRNIRLRKELWNIYWKKMMVEKGCLVNGRHLYCERRAPKDEQLGVGLVLALEAAPVMHQPSSVIVSGLGAGAGPSDIHQIIGLTIQAERQSGAHPKVPISSLTTAQMISGLLYEDLSMINYTVSHGLPEDFDLDEEIKDEITEEIEELEELMIEYRIGLAGAIIEAHMKRQKYEANVVGSPLDDEKCCICQENYADNEDLGKLDCGHYFHFDCIKQWLIQKNNYPICKRKALQV
ncbi:hypothetical protein GH714_013048 [Hevea brasiliensis]|uniref:RING-type E3 ubiquitin transferase n=1 Tax=Hevea brasiliensis TaxID=3981 RepID=A0A6A6MX62_HEVBR|nr:hypothetical protein GH714_013048 [Hevea brasiliensis]